MKEVIMRLTSDHIKVKGAEAEMYICNANDQDLYEAEHFCSYGERESE